MRRFRILRPAGQTGKPPPPPPSQIAQWCLGKCYGDVECAATLARHYARGRNLQTVIASIGTTFLRGARAHHEQAELVVAVSASLARFLCDAVGAAHPLFGTCGRRKFRPLPSPALAPATWLGIWNRLACVAPTAATSRPDRMPACSRGRTARCARHHHQPAAQSALMHELIVRFVATGLPVWLLIDSRLGEQPTRNAIFAARSDIVVIGRVKVG